MHDQTRLSSLASTRRSPSEAEQIDWVVELRERELAQMPRKCRQAGLAPGDGRGYSWRYTSNEVLVLARCKVTPAMSAACDIPPADWDRLRRWDRNFATVDAYRRSTAFARGFVDAFHRGRDLGPDGDALLELSHSELEVLAFIRLALHVGVTDAVALVGDCEDRAWLLANFDRHPTAASLRAAYAAHLAGFVPCPGCGGQLGEPSGHSCPYDAELGTGTKVCHCCAACTHRCANEV